MAFEITNRRRRQRHESDTNHLGNEDYYDDSSDSDNSRKGHDEKLYGSACSFGQFALNPCLCLFRSGKACFAVMNRRYNSASVQPVSEGKLKNGLRRKKMDKVDGLLIFALLALFCTFIYVMSPTLRFGWSRIFRSRSRARWVTVYNDADQLPILLPCFDFQRWGVDVGGWSFDRSFYQPTQELITTLGHPGDYRDPICTYPCHEFDFYGKFGEPRSIRPDDEELFEVHMEQWHGVNYKLKTSWEYAEDVQDQDEICMRNNWMQNYYPTCNAFHEMDLSQDYDADRAGLGDDQVFDSFYTSHGYWRDVWVVDQVSQNEKTILKTLRWEHDYETSNFWQTLYDALVMERLTKSPRIVDIFGHCGFSVHVEALPFEVQEVVVPGAGYIKQEELHDEFDLQPQNDFTEEEKLDMALVMAESIADLHGFADGLIVHGDIQLCQWLRSRDGMIKLGDFNRAEFPGFDTKKQEYCKYNIGGGFGNYRSPEEVAGRDLDEKIDVFSFGNNIYGLLTGLWVFYENTDDGVVQEKLTKGETAFVDKRYREGSFVTKKLVEVMENAWILNPNDRISIFDVAEMLRKIKLEHEGMKHNGSKD